MLTAAPGQIITLTWPRTADPDGTVADGSSQLNIYYNPNATINAGVSFGIGRFMYTDHMLLRLNTQILHTFQMYRNISCCSICCACMSGFFAQYICDLAPLSSCRGMLLGLLLSNCSECCRDKLQQQHRPQPSCLPAVPPGKPVICRQWCLRCG